jgi:RNA polymerase sigma factor (sigma-70 family)
MTNLSRMIATAKAQPAPASERDRLVLENMPLVAMVCQRVLCRGKPTDDMIQTGMIGLIKAAKVFDPGRGFKFSTLAYRCIWVALAQEYSLQKRRERVNVTTTNAPETIPDKATVQPVESAQLSERQLLNREQISIALNHMRESDRVAVLAKYGRDETLHQIGQRWGITKQRVSQRIRRGIREARHKMGLN